MEAKLSHQFPRLFSYVKDKLISVKEYLLLEDPTDAYYLPLSAEAYQEYIDMTQLLQGVVPSESSDKWISCLAKGGYTSSSFYQFYFSGITTHMPSCWI